MKKKYAIEKLPTIDWFDFLGPNTVSVTNYSFLSGTSLITDIALLKILAGKFDKCSYLEIGSWRGESLVNVAQVAHECYSLSLSPMEMREKKMGEEFIRVHGIFSKEVKNITSIGHDSTTFDFSKLNKKFDLIFVDGDHTFEAIKKDSENVFSLLKDENSIIVWHDYGYDPETPRFTTIAGILEGIPKENHRFLYHVSNTMCAVFCRKKFETRLTVFPTFPNKFFNLSLSPLKLH